MTWRKEKREHPWASTATAKQIAKDHAKKKQHRVTHKTQSVAIQAAKKDLSLLYGKSQKIACGSHKLGEN